MHSVHQASASARLTDTGGVIVVHSMFRREVRLAGDLVRRVEPGDTRRSGVVAGHLDLVDRCLHHHHITEDRLVWPLLLARAGNDVAPMVELMESQHAVVATLLARIEPRRARWAETADASGRDELAALYDRLAVALVEHLDEEEARVLPIAAACLSRSEWDAIGDAGRRGTRRSERSLVFGMLQYDGDPRVVATMLGSAPKPVRVLLPCLARRAFRRHALAVHGTATP